MSSRANKETILKDNKDRALARSKESYKKENHTSMPKERQEYEKKELNKAVKRADSMLPKVWNDEPSKASNISPRPMFGYFGGVDFDENGKIIQ